MGSQEFGCGKLIHGGQEPFSQFGPPRDSLSLLNLFLLTVCKHLVGLCCYLFLNMEASLEETLFFTQDFFDQELQLMA